MQTVQLDFATDDALTGFRLERMEVLNWGTFHRHIWRIDPTGRNSLLTGDIGSGKSTLVDAITTLLVPHQRIVYNKAAGAESKERSLYSYLRGEFKSEQDEHTQIAKAVTLRDANSYTVLLTYFYNRGFEQGVTLAQVFWLKDGRTNPERFFVVAEVPLTIAEHFSGFGNDILDLKKRLRKMAHVQVLEQFKEYSTRFRHAFGIQHEKALELFYQTVSMKSVGNLTEFVRHHMLEKSDVGTRIDALRRAFDNLNRAHEAVLKAKEQIERLTPLVQDGELYQALSQSIEELAACRDALDAYFAAHKVRLTQVQIQRLEDEIAAISTRVQKLRREIDELRAQEDSLKAGIEDNGGSRLRAIDQEMDQRAAERDRRVLTHSRYQRYQQALDLAAISDAQGFGKNRDRVTALQIKLKGEVEELDRTKTDRAVDLRELRRQGEELEKELASLRGRKSNVPLRSLEIRREMAETLGLAEDDVPFAGELLQVDEGEARWEGAIERLLHGFGLSLLVPEEAYAQVSRYVDRTHLRGRLVYYRVRHGEGRTPGRTPDPRSLARKLRIKPDGPFYAWLESWLAEHFDFVCCENLQELRRLPKAVTAQGQIKSGGRRHEKDDRRSIHDRSHYVLGWSNEEKIRVLESRLADLGEQGQRLAAELEALRGRQQALNDQRDCARDLLLIERYDDIHWQEVAREIQLLEEEKRALEESSDKLRSLREQLRTVQGTIGASIERERRLAEKTGGLKKDREIALANIETAREQAARVPEELRKHLYPRIEEYCRIALEGVELRLQTLDRSQSTVREHIQRRFDSERGKSDRVLQRLIRQMQDYRSAYPAETQEVDAAVEAVPEYAAMLQALRDEDLPRHEARFRAMLKEDTINSVAMFQGQLERQRQEIGEKIETINRSLQEIEYDSGTYITLLTDSAPDPEIRDFRRDLRECLSKTMGEDELYTEEKFLQVKAIIDRFNGREGLVDQDRRWTLKVTDVRNWFNFSASERWREDGKEKEFYSDASGKSGGQKEKLAYTILASALAYQFGLEWNTVRSRSFRFVVIDEAFGRGSDESTRYALELFKKLNLQLLIVTPLQKIRVIEGYINAVHFVHNEGGQNSIVRNLTVEEYQAEKQRFLAQARV